MIETVSNNTISPYSYPGILRKERITLSAIERMVCESLGLGTDVPKKKTQETASVLPRNMFFYFACKYQDHFMVQTPLKFIGSYYGKNHSTVLNGEKRIRYRIETERPFRELCSRIDEQARELFI